jgi:putative transposase
MILTYKIKHNRDFTYELAKAFEVAKFVVKNKITYSNTTFVKDIRGGLPSAIAGQIMRKYGRQKKIKAVHNVNLIVPAQSIKFFEETNSIWISCLKLHLENTIPYNFTKINQVELDNEYCSIAVTILAQPEMIPQSCIGVDRNTTGHIAVTANLNTGKIEKFGKKAIHIHKKYSAIRKQLQKEGKFRDLKKTKGRESNIVKDLNHKISRKLVDMAKDQNAALVFEDLKGISKKNKQSHSFKYALHSWSFYQLQQFVEYKAKLLGVPVLYVDPAYTSQDCSICGARGQRNGKEFKCPVCGHVDHADVNAAFNIALRQKSMIDHTQKEMCTMGALIPHDAMLECPVTSKQTFSTKEYVSVRKDFGLTQITPNTLTCIAIGPDEDEKIDAVIKGLKLL